MQLISDTWRLLLKSYSIGGLLILPGPFSWKISVLLLKRVLLPPPAVVVCVHAHTRVCQRVCVCHWVYTSINRHEDEDFGKHFYCFFYTWIGSWAQANWNKVCTSNIGWDPTKSTSMWFHTGEKPQLGPSAGEFKQSVTHLSVMRHRWGVWLFDYFV